MTLQVTADDRDGWYVLRVSGDMDLVTSPQVRQRIHDAVADGRRWLVLDLSAVRFCDSSGVGVLIAARRLLRSCGGSFRLILPVEGAAAGGRRTARQGEGSAHVNRVLAALGVRRLFEVYEDVDDATGDEAEPLSA